MHGLKRFRRRELTTVTAVQIDLETEGFTYKKWGYDQVARPGDWLVNNNGNTYTIDRQVFEQTYTEISPGIFKKTGFVWAKRSQTDGKIRTTSGFTNYQAGEMLVFNTEHGTDGWAMSREEFNRLYALDS